MTMQYVFPTYARFPFEIVSGKDFTLTDNHGKQYQDFTSGIGVCGLGYNNEALNKAVIDQVQKVWHTSNLYESQLQDDVAHLIVKDEDMLVSFCNSGTEANEVALKLARKASGKQNILTFNDSFHGRSYGSLSVTGNEPIKEGFGAMLPGAIYGTYNDPAALDLITSDLAGVMLEVIQGEGGINVGDPDWLKAVEAKCHQEGVLLIIDEVQTGMGRTGELYAFQNYDLHPDIFTLAKCLANGLPVGAMVGKKSLAEFFGPGSHGSTFAGNPIAMAAAKVVLETIDADFLACVKKKSEHIWNEINEQLVDLDAVESVTGKGLMIGIHLKENVPVNEVITKLQDARLLTISSKHNTLRLLPPLITPCCQLCKGVETIANVLKTY